MDGLTASAVADIAMLCAAMSHALAGIYGRPLRWFVYARNRLAAVTGLGIGVFGRRHAPSRIVGVGEGLPELPTDTVVLHTPLVGDISRTIRLAFAKIGAWN